MFRRTTVAALNHLLAQNNWALARLAKFSGKTARFDIAPFSFACTVLPDGLLARAVPAAGADAHCVIPPSLLPRLALHDENAHRDIHSEGDPDLLAEIFFLSRNLRWDAAHDLSRITGDVAAERMVHASQQARQQVQAAAKNFSQAAAEYWTEERPLLAKATQIDLFIRQVDTLRDDIARLQQRLKRLP
ncbi:MAG: ubiquinone biosynthesis accessory factor UbiJ [Pseudomonadota bacterium]